MKTFDSLRIAKLGAFDFDKKPLAFISAYLENRKQKFKVGSVSSDFSNILCGVPQGSILDPILFIIFIGDLFYINGNLDYASYTYDASPYVCRFNFAKAIDFFEANIKKIFAWFKRNRIKNKLR